MRTKRDFKCVDYKRRVQEKHAAEAVGLTPQEKTQRRSQWLRESENAAARMWRKLSARQESAVLS